MAAITIQICLNTNRSVSKICKIKPDSNDKFYKKLIKLSKDKLRIKKKPQKLFLIQTGQEITRSNINELISAQYANHFTTNLSISVSLGEQYVGKTIDATTIEKQTCLIRCLVSSATITSEAEKQLQACQRLSGMKLVVALPDIHAGKGYPIGVSLISENVVYPYLIGTDIGCGMALLQTNISKGSVNKQKLNRWIKDIKLDEPWMNVNDRKTDTNKNKKEYMKRILSDTLKDWPKHTTQDGIDVDGVIKNGINIHNFDRTLGTIGHGNHFAELQCIHQICDDNLCRQLGLDENKLFLMIHSGSRGFGAAVLDNYLKTHKSHTPLDTACDDFKSYMMLHNNALKWARKNRMIIAQRFLRCMGSGAAYEVKNCVCHMDIYHNYLCSKPKDKFVDVEREIDCKTEMEEKINVVDIYPEKNKMKRKLYSNSNSPCLGMLDELISIFDIDDDEQKNINELGQEHDVWYIHRKGAAPTDSGCVVIPGSRGSYSYIVKPNDNMGSYSGYSLAHGAGRKLMRSQAIKKMSKKYPNANQLKKTALDSYVICNDKSLLYEEAPDAYKDITNVIQDLISHNLITVVAILKPIITYKNKKELGHKFKHKHKHSRSDLLSYDD